MKKSRRMTITLDPLATAIVENLQAKSQNISAWIGYAICLAHAKGLDTVDQVASAVSDEMHGRSRPCSRP